KMRKTMLKQEFSEFSMSEEEGLHKGYDRLQKILSQLNQMQEKLDNDDVNIKFLKALPPSWSQVALTHKTRGSLEYLSFNDLYNKLRSLEIDVKGGSSYGSRSTTVAPTHSAFICAASTNTKMVYSNQPSHSSSITYTFANSSSIMKDVLHSFVAENKPTQQLAYEDFKQVDQLEMEELDIKWQMAMLSLRINKFQKMAGRKINFKDSARFDRRKARCYNYLNSSASTSAGRSILAASRNKPASIYDGRNFPAGRYVPTGWTNHAAKPFFKQTNVYFNNISWPGINEHMSMNEGRWGSIVKSSAVCSWRYSRPYMKWGSKKNGGSHQSTWFHT
nr:ribonuclease H-like domain-containing protein [Tanacetum cinerariifolium]